MSALLTASDIVSGYLNRPVLHGVSAQVAEGVQAFFEAGATSVMLQPTDGDQGLEAFMGHVGEVVRLHAAR